MYCTIPHATQTVAISSSNQEDIILFKYYEYII